MRSFTLPAGLKYSNFARIFALSLCFRSRLANSKSGVLPINSVRLRAIFAIVDTSGSGPGHATRIPVKPSACTCRAKYLIPYLSYGARPLFPFSERLIFTVNENRTTPGEPSLLGETSKKTPFLRINDISNLTQGNFFADWLERSVNALSFINASPDLSDPSTKIRRCTTGIIRY